MKLPKWDSRSWLAIASVLMLAGTFAALLGIRIPDENRDLVIALASGVIGAAFKDVYGFYFGSSKGTAEANERTDAILAATEEGKK